MRLLNVRRIRRRIGLLIWFSTVLLTLCSISSFADGKKQIAILGDSYSAYYGYIPKGYKCSYAIYGKDGQNKWNNNINSVTQMWWYPLIMSEEYKLSVNCSYSGTCFCGTKKNSNSYVLRMKKQLNGSRKADIIFVEGGTNDSWNRRAIGKLRYENWNQKNLNRSLPAFCYILNYLKAHYPQAQIIVLINNKYIHGRLLAGMKTACDYYEIPYLLLGNISTQSRHPDKKGQQQIYHTVASYLENNEYVHHTSDSAGL